MKEKENDLEAVKSFIDAVINMRNTIKQYFIQKMRNSELQGLTYEMFQVLVVLWSKKQANQQDIANAVQKNKASLTPLIDNLCKRDLVVRTPDPADRRNNVISLTAKGSEYEQLFRPMQQEFYQVLLSEASSKEIAQLSATLNRLASRSSAD